MGQKLARKTVDETVLVVDDEPTVRMLVAETLKDQGLATVEAENADAALLILQSAARIDLMVTDITLPGVNGRQLAETAKHLRPGLKVLFMTGYAHDAGFGSASSGGAEIITKPFSLAMLGLKVHNLLAESSPSSS